MKISAKYLALVFASILLFASCKKSSTTQVEKTSLQKDIKEVEPGYIEGYLSKSELPNSLVLLPLPPDENSAAFILDQEIASKYVAMKDSARRQQAIEDTELYFPDALKGFNRVLNTTISEENTPHLYVILRRSLADAGLSTYGAKKHYKRARPFMFNNTPTFTPEPDSLLRLDGSYPSGHTAIGWAWALILVEVFPEHTEAILERGKQFGISRNVCNVHWHSDVVAGRYMGTATVARLHANTNFTIDMKVAKEEVKALLKK